MFSSETLRYLADLPKGLPLNLNEWTVSENKWPTGLNCHGKSADQILQQHSEAKDAELEKVGP